MRRLASLPIVLLLTCSAWATPYVPPDQITVHVGETWFTAPELDATFNHMVEFVQIAGFEQPLQCEDPGSNFGGEREEEPGGLYYIMETDNTLEAIQVWSRYYQLTGNSQYNDEINDAWIYAYTWPAWLEGAGYYSAHNCAWALAAELQYRTTFGDSAHWNYAINSANYILQTELPFSSPVNVMVTGWCCGNLYLYGEATNNEIYMRVACQRARQIMDWVEMDPQNRLAMESWAMSSGTFVWGLCNSLFRYDPALGQQWLATYGPMVQVFEPSTGGWSNAWNVAYANAQGGMFDVTENPVSGSNHLALTNFLLRQDLDNDGGIPASAAGSQNADASWTTCYLALMGANRYLGSPVDAGVLIVTSPRNCSPLNQGAPIAVTALLGNWGTQALSNVLVTVSGAYQDTLYANLPVLQNVPVDFGLWTPSVPGIDSLWVTVHAEGDTVAFNNADTSRFRVRPVQDMAVGMRETGALLKIGSSSKSILFTLPEAGQVELILCNALGQRIKTLTDGRYPAGQHNLDLRFADLPSGLYFIRLRAGKMQQVQKLVVLR